MKPPAPQQVPAGAPWLDRWRREFGDSERSRLAQLATVSPDGSPAVRTVVLRGLSEDAAPYFASDRRSAKIRSVRGGSRAELCVWWSEPGVQVRLRGPLHVIDEEAAGAWAEVRAEVWRTLRAPERRGFAGPGPGTPLTEPTAQIELPEDPHPNFVLAVLTPLRFDHLTLGDPHHREVHRWMSAGWTGGRVHP